MSHQRKRKRKANASQSSIRFASTGLSVYCRIQRDSQLRANEREFASATRVIAINLVPIPEFRRDIIHAVNEMCETIVTLTAKNSALNAKQLRRRETNYRYSFAGRKQRKQITVAYESTTEIIPQRANDNYIVIVGLACFVT